jgi:hypothetical protein
MSNLVECKSCGKEVAKGAKVCPHCGKKLKMGLFLKLVIGIVGLSILGTILAPSSEDLISEVKSAQVTNINPSGELAELFTFGGDGTDIQRDNKEAEITGKYVEWSLPVFDVNKTSENKYRVQTSSSEAIFGGRKSVGAFIVIHTSGDAENQYVEGLKEKDIITFKGKIKGTSMRNISIDPAIVIIK